MAIGGDKLVNRPFGFSFLSMLGSLFGAFFAVIVFICTRPEEYKEHLKKEGEDEVETKQLEAYGKREVIDIRDKPAEEEKPKEAEPKAAESPAADVKVEVAEPAAADTAAADTADVTVEVAGEAAEEP